MSHVGRYAFYKNVKIYTNIWWKHVYEDIGEHANSDHHRLKCYETK